MPYAVGRVRVLRKDALDAQRLDRLTSAHTLDEARRALVDIGWAGADGMDAEKVADDHVLRACTLVKSVTPAPRVTDCFLLRYDIHNLKTLIKARMLSQKPEYLSACGLYPVEKLRHAVTDHTYRCLPDTLRDAMDALEKKIAAGVSAMEVDVLLDAAHFKTVFLWLADAKCDTALRYFKARVSLTNLVSLLRVRAMRKDARFLRGVLIAGGDVPEETLLKHFETPEKLPRLYERYGKRVMGAAEAAVLNPAALPALEKAADDALYALFAPYRYALTEIEPVIAHLLRAQREAGVVRLLLAARANDFPQEAVTERMRELNG